MPEEGPFVSKELKPFQKLASLTSSHVKWYIRDWETENVIVSIGDFPNVPLIGTKGCINYNPMLSLRQHGYPMNGPPKVEALEPFILHGVEMDHPMVKKIKRSWQAVIRKGKELGRRNVIAQEPYTCWVRERVQMIKLPYPFDPSIYPVIPEPEPILPEDVEKLNNRIKELELENADLRIRLGRVSVENGNLKDDQQKKDKELEVSNKRARESEARREKFGQALFSTKSVFKSKEEELDRALLRIQKLNKTLELTLEMKREARLISEIRTRELENTIQKYQDALEREKLKTEESERVCTRLKHHLDRADARIQALEGGDQDAAYMVLLNECRYWRNLYRGIEVTKAEDVRIIQDLQGLYTEWKGKFLKLSGFASSIMRELPEKLQEADWCMCPENTPHQVYNFIKFCLVIPAKFKTPDFDKYEGHSCPKSHLIMYYRKMAAHVEDDKLMIHCFQDSLRGAPSKWYLSLDQSRIRCFQDLSDAFIQHYKYNMDMAPDRRQLLIKPVFYERMVSSVSASFSDLVAVGIKVELGLKNGKMTTTSETSGSNAKKFPGGFQRKKEGDTNAVSTSQRRSQSWKKPHQFSRQQPIYPVQYVQQPYVAAVTPNFNQPPASVYQPVPAQQAPMYQQAPAPPAYQQPRAQAPRPQNPQNQNRAPRNRAPFAAIPMTYTELYPSLLQKGLVTPRSLDLVEKKILSFRDVGPNVKNNPLPAHGDVNAVEDASDMCVIKNVEDVKTPLLTLHAGLVRARLIDTCHDSCEECAIQPKGCKVVRNDIQSLMNQGVLQISGPAINEEISVIEPVFNIPEPFEVTYHRRDVVHPSPVVVCMPTPFPFESTKAVPWKYGITVVDGVVDGKPEATESKKGVENVDADITNIAGTSRMTRSGRIYTPNFDVNPQEPARGAANVNPTPEQGGAQPAVQTDEAKTSFQALEISNATLEEVKDPVEKASLSFASLKSAKSAVESGGPAGWGQLLHEYVDVFAWSYQDMPGLDTDIVVHKLPLQPDCPPVKQKLRRARPDMALKICDEVKRQFDAGFLAVAKYPQWVANIVPVPKKDGKVRMCVDYRDLNKASPKDDFPLPHIDTLVDNTAKFAVFSFMDGFSGYNQIKMDPEDMEKTTFITPWGTFCYKVMPFGLKNAGATYQRAMVTLFHDMMHKEIEVYVDDMIAKSQSEEDHIDHLQKLFERLRKFRLRLNPAKCTFGVRSGKLLGFIVSQRGIEVDPDKVRAIQEMPAPRTEREVRGFLGRLNYISRFISHMTATCEPIFKLLRKDQAVEWNSDCQMAFERIGQYLQEPPILIPPVQGRPLFMYLTVLEKSMGCVLGQHDETGRKEHAIYYLSKRFTDCETRYSLLEKTCCALAWAARRLRQYMICHTTLLISKMDPIKYIFEKPALTGRLARWQMLLSEYDIQYVSQKAIKGSVLSDYLANQPVEDYQSLKFDFPDEDIMLVKDCEIPGLDEGPEPGSRWKLMFDARLCFDCTNNIAEYEACILGIEAAIDLRIKILEVCGDSALVIYQVKGEWETRDTKLIPYRAYVMELIKYFDEITFRHIPRTENQIADALAMLASMYQVRFHNEAPLIQIERKVEPAYCQSVEEEADGKPWFHDIKCFLQNQEYPTDATTLDKKTLRKLASKFFLSNGVLYKRNHDMILLRCVDGREADLLIKEIHEGSFGTHANGHAMAKKILRAVNVLTSPWPFSMWGIDMIGAIEPKASNGHRFILVAIDYFTKWVEAASYANVTKQVVARFLKKEIICRYGIPSRIITDNGTNLNNKTMKELCESFKIEHHNSSPYRPKMNGAVEAANKNIKKILVYGMEAVLPIEVEIPSMRILMETKLEEAEWIQNRFDQLNLIDEKRLTSLCHGQLYQKRLKRAFDKKVRVREFREGDLVLKKILPIHKDSRGKWTPNYEGPYVVKKVFSGGALILTTMDDEELSHPVNSDAVKK
ncbi:uncharacterized protein LOC127095610, partial [Lathyrus oleraceus]|uniref:uncharacterized protein LOC127095610 n=1 Tax=Pisum sativum TaxID=3888 RepID=UPI0021CFEBB1